MKKIGIAEARQSLSRMIEDVFFRDEEWMLTKSGEPRAVLISFERYEELMSAEATYEELTDPEAIKHNMLADADIAAGRVIEHDVFMAKIREEKRRRA